MKKTKNFSRGTSKLLNCLKKGKIYDLGKEFYPGMTHNRVHPSFVFSLIRSHSESTRKGDPNRSSAACFFVMGGHTGTHIDALGHYAKEGQIFGHKGKNISEIENYTKGLPIGGVENTPPILRHGVLLDMARLHGAEVLPSDYKIDEKNLEAALEEERVKLNPGDVLLIRTGWMKYWNEPAKYCGIAPGVTAGGARWIAEHKVAFTGSDTSAFEKMDQTEKQVHVILLAQHGIQIMECLYIEELAKDNRWEFLFVTLPLKIRGATGSPIRPIAIVP